MNKNTSAVEIPVGLGLALEQYNAMDYFLSLSPEGQKQMIDQSHKVQSKDEMRNFVQSIVTHIK